MLDFADALQNYLRPVLLTLARLLLTIFIKSCFPLVVRLSLSDQRIMDFLYFVCERCIFVQDGRLVLLRISHVLIADVFKLP